MNSSATIRGLDDLRRSALLGKDRHFIASRRNKFLSTLFGLPVVVINIVLGSVLFVSLSEELPQIMKWTGAFLALLGAGGAGIQTFFNFHKVFEGHRRVANRYLSLGRECQRLKGLHEDDLLELDALSKGLEFLEKDYAEINASAETFVTTDSDYRRSLKLEKKRQNRKQQKALESNP